MDLINSQATRFAVVVRCCKSRPCPGRGGGGGGEWRTGSLPNIARHVHQPVAVGGVMAHGGGPEPAIGGAIFPGEEPLPGVGHPLTLGG